MTRESVNNSPKIACVCVCACVCPTSKRVAINNCRRMPNFAHDPDLISSACKSI